MTIHECKEHGAGPCLNETLIGEIAEANATLADRITALEAQVAALTAERDELQQTIATLQSQLQSVTADRDGETRWAHHYFTAWQSARQSRARLVAHVRRLRAKFSETMPDSAYVKRITAERDAARAWAAAWRSCAHWWFYVPRETDRYWFKDEFADQARQRRARRAAEAADAMERR